MNCEDFLIQKSALLDGEQADLPAAEIDAHLAQCENCRREIEQFRGVGVLFENQARRSAPPADLWSTIEKRIGSGAKDGFAVAWQPVVAVGVLLVALKLLEMIPARDLGWMLKIAPFALIVVLFGFLKENPFRINTDLITEK